MTRVRSIVTLGFCLLAVSVSAAEQAETGWDLSSSEGEVVYDLNTGVATVTNGVVIRYGGVVLSADKASVNQQTGDAVADGRVRIQQADQVWTGEHIRYNFKTHQMEAQAFRTGKTPVYAAGQGLRGDVTNHVYYATNAFITTDDIAQPAMKIRARHITIIPGKRIEARQATLCVGDVPILYFPYYSRNLGANANNFNFIPGYRTSYGSFILGSYVWYLNEQLDGVLHLDYRQKRGLGVGPDFSYHLGRWGQGEARYYYTHDDDPGTNTAGAALPSDRQRVYFTYQSNPFTNTYLKSFVRYQSDSDIIKDFYEGEYRQDPQPDTYVEANRLWQNFSLDGLYQPRLLGFLETVERLPEVRLTGFPQQIGKTPFYYETENSAGFYERQFAGTNSPYAPTNRPIPPNFSGTRADTFQQITLPETFFGWLNVIPRVGGRFTYYSPVDVVSPAPGYTTNSDVYRGVFNTGAEVTFKASRLWAGIRNQALNLNGLRHIIQPSVNYVYVPTPNYQPDQLPQFDYQLPSLRLLPIDFPEYNSIDSIDSQNVLRFGLGNQLQTKRDGKVQDLLSWQLFADWRLQTLTNQQTFSDLYSDLTFKPRSWITLVSQTRFDLNTYAWNMLLDSVTFEPNDTWSWTIGQYYLRNNYSDSPTAWGPGSSLIASRFYLKFNENWGFRATQHYDLVNHRMQEQYFTIYRDLRSFTVALTGGVLNNSSGPKDYTIAFSFSLKAVPRFGLGRDTVEPYSLIGQ
jgi:LPS-assembly protein